MFKYGNTVCIPLHLHAGFVRLYDSLENKRLLKKLIDLRYRYFNVCSFFLRCNIKPVN